MVDIAGLDVALPSIDISGFLSSTWLYVFIVGIIGFIIIVVVALLLFFRTYNRKVEVYENIAGMGYRKTLTTRARLVKLGLAGEEVLKTLAGGRYLTAYGRKTGINTYMFVKGSDGYLYNAVHGDFDTKLAMLDIEPIDRDVRMFHVAMARLAAANYDKKSFMDKYGGWIVIFIIMVVMFIGFYVVGGQNINAAKQFSEAAKIIADAVKSSAPTTTGLVGA
jgi:uncharacterized protein YpmB